MPWPFSIAAGDSIRRIKSLHFIDLSASMVKEDFTDASGKQVDRLVAVKEVLGDFLTRREGDRVGWW